MTDSNYLFDLVVLVADKDIEQSMHGILERYESLGIRKINFKIIPHPQKDPGCFKEGHDLLRPFVRTYANAMVIFDRDGCGQEDKPREVIEKEVEERLSASGWGNRAAAIVIDPELENWLWSDSPEVDAAVRWKGKSPVLREWLKMKGYFKEGSVKPFPPKEALKEALKEVRMPASSSIFRKIAEKVSLKRCQDIAFNKLKDRLLLWYRVDKE